MKQLEIEGVRITFDCALESIDRSGIASFSCTNGSSFQMKARLVIGCDGAYSKVRSALSKLVSTNLHRTYISHGYKELHMPANEDTKSLRIGKHLRLYTSGLVMNS